MTSEGVGVPVMASYAGRFCVDGTCLFEYNGQPSDVDCTFRSCYSIIDGSIPSGFYKSYCTSLKGLRAAFFPQHPAWLPDPPLYERPQIHLAPMQRKRVPSMMGSKRRDGLHSKKPFAVAANTKMQTLLVRKVKRTVSNIVP